MDLLRLVDRVGNNIQTTGQITVEFGNFGGLLGPCHLHTIRPATVAAGPARRGRLARSRALEAAAAERNHRVWRSRSPSTPSRTPINQDGGLAVVGQGLLRSVRTGRGVSGLALRSGHGGGAAVAQDFGTLSARSVGDQWRWRGDSRIHRRRPSPVNGLFGTCSGLPGQLRLDRRGRRTATNFTTANPELVTIRLVPTGVIQAARRSAGPRNSRFSPTPVKLQHPVDLRCVDECSRQPARGGDHELRVDVRRWLVRHRQGP